MYQDEEDRQSRRKNRFATASVILAVISLIFLLVFYISIPCGALAAIFALLSREKNRKMRGKAKAGAIIGLACAVGSFGITAYSFYVLSTNPAVRAQVQYMVNQYAAQMGLDTRFEDVFGGPALPDSQPQDPLEAILGGEENVTERSDYYNSSDFWEDLLSGKDVSDRVPSSQKQKEQKEEAAVPETEEIPMVAPAQEGSYL